MTINRMTAPVCAVMCNLINTLTPFVESIIDPLIPLGRTDASGIE